MARRNALWRPALAALLIFLVVFSHVRLAKTYDPGFPSFKELMVLDDKASLQDILLIVSGFRSAAADLAWIQLLQYMGGASILDIVDKSRDYRLLKPLTLRVVHIDPYFVRAYIFGAGLLGWLRVVNRPQEAIELLEEGIRYNPTYWPFHSYLVGIGYQQSDQLDKMMEVLGPTLSRPDCPLLVKAVLANTFKLNKRYQAALDIWLGVYTTTEDPSYKHRALEQIEELRALMGTPAKK